MPETVHPTRIRMGNCAKIGLRFLKRVKETARPPSRLLVSLILLDLWNAGLHCSPTPAYQQIHRLVDRDMTVLVTAIQLHGSSCAQRVLFQLPSMEEIDDPGASDATATGMYFTLELKGKTFT